MENTNETPNETSPNNDEQHTVEQEALVLTKSLMDNVQQIGRAGKVVMPLFLVLSGLYALNFCIDFLSWTGRLQGEFYLLEKNNLYRIWSFCTEIGAIYLFTRGAWVGFQVARDINAGVRFDDDDALLNGFERLTPMFRWFVLWGAFWLGCAILEKIYFWSTLK